MAFETKSNNWRISVVDPADRASGTLPEGHPLRAPGLKWRPRKGEDVPYWIPPAKDIRAGYAPKSITLDPAMDQLELAERCRRQWQDLIDWRDGSKTRVTRLTIAWLIDRYENDKFSPIWSVKAKSRDEYRAFNAIIRASIGERRLEPYVENGAARPRVLGEDVRRWHDNWGFPVPIVENGAPVLDERGEPVTELSKPARARRTVTQLRMLVKYAVTIGVPGAVELCDMICNKLRFPVPKPRDVAPTRAQVTAFVDKAVELGHISLAITTLAQFELTERRIHIIGEWETKTRWRPGWLWSGLRGTVIHYSQEKNAEVKREYDLAVIPRLLELLDVIPNDQRVGAIIKRESTGAPWRDKAFGKAFRVVARAAGLPDEIWSMDMRAAGATEADDIEAITPRMLQDGLGHANLATQERYRRGKIRNAQKVVDLRQRATQKA